MMFHFFACFFLTPPDEPHLTMSAVSKYCQQLRDNNITRIKSVRPPTIHNHLVHTTIPSPSFVSKTGTKEICAKQPNEKRTYHQLEAKPPSESLHCNITLNFFPGRNQIHIQTEHSGSSFSFPLLLFISPVRVGFVVCSGDPSSLSKNKIGDPEATSLADAVRVNATLTNL
jgi:hypothetical protein